MLRVVLGLALIAVTLTACGGKSSAPEPPATGQSTAAGDSLAVKMYRTPT